MNCKKTLSDKILDMSVEVKAIADILFVCSCLYGERGDDNAPVVNERIESALLGLSCYAERVSDTMADIDTVGAQK